jgi:hypothetical protein
VLKKSTSSQNFGIIKGDCLSFLVAAIILATDGAVGAGEFGHFNSGLTNLHGLVAVDPGPVWRNTSDTRNLQLGSSFA